MSIPLNTPNVIPLSKVDKVMTHGDPILWQSSWLKGDNWGYEKLIKPHVNIEKNGVF